MLRVVWECGNRSKLNDLNEICTYDLELTIPRNVAEDVRKLGVRLYGADYSCQQLQPVPPRDCH